MNILMMSNTYAPHVGGVARSVESFSEAYRERGHRVLVVAPEFDNMPDEERDVVRVAAIQHFNGTDFSVALPVSNRLRRALDHFEPDIVHSHHPFLIGSTALRVAHIRELPLVFTHHTMYEQYTHYVPGDSDALKQFVVRLSTSYANLCEHVIAPSESVAAILRERGVEVPITTVPTGVIPERFRQGSGAGFRRAMQIPADAFVVGHLGRLAPEKNLAFLVEAVATFMRRSERAHFLIVGVGPSTASVRERMKRSDLAARLHMVGILEQPLLASAYQAMDVFAFASKSETQGMVLTEAMAAGVPVVALDGPGVREVVHAGNGECLRSQNHEAFAHALAAIASLPRRARQALRRGARATAESLSMDHTSQRCLDIYADLIGHHPVQHRAAFEAWRNARRLIEAEWGLLKGLAGGRGSR